MTQTILTINWLFGGFALLTSIMLFSAFKAGREAKQSPYYFLRRQAEQRMQQYGMAAFVLGIASTAIGFYAWNPPPNDELRMAYIEAVKPEKVGSVSIEEEPEVTVALEQMGGIVSSSAPVAQVAIEVEEGLPAQFAQQHDSLVKLSNDTRLGAISFAQEVDETYQPISPDDAFPSGAYRLYATFDYEQMADGMEWAWVWRYNGAVIDGGTEEWTYGEEGPGYVYFEPEEGFRPGEYELQIWVNETKLSEASVAVTSAALR